MLGCDVFGGSGVGRSILDSVGDGRLDLSGVLLLKLVLLLRKSFDASLEGTLVHRVMSTCEIRAQCQTYRLLLQAADFALERNKALLQSLDKETTQSAIMPIMTK